MTNRQVRNRWIAIVAMRIVGSAGAVFGVVLLARARDVPTKVLAVAIVLAALWFIAVVPRALAHRWRTPPE